MLLIRDQMISVVVGFVFEDIFITLWTGLGLTLAIMFLIVPPWPMYNRHPVRWLGSSVLPAGGISIGGKRLR